MRNCPGLPERAGKPPDSDAQTPGVWEPSLGGFPALSALPGQFLIKDLALLGISLWSFGESWKAGVRAAA